MLTVYDVHSLGVPSLGSYPDLYNIEKFKSVSKQNNTLYQNRIIHISVVSRCSRVSFFYTKNTYVRMLMVFSVRKKW